MIRSHSGARISTGVEKKKKEGASRGKYAEYGYTCVTPECFQRGKTFILFPVVWVDMVQ